MHRLLIVDDDEIFRTGIEKNIDWAANDIEIAGTARNGHECLEMIQTCLPEIILTDIKMPFMNGMQLAEAVYHLYPNIKIVLLTAYEDFAYAKEALGFKVCEYVLKCEDNNAVIAAIKKAATEYDKRKNDTDILKKSTQLLRNKFLCDLLHNDYDTQTFMRQVRQLGLNLSGKRFQVLCINITPKPGAKAETIAWQEEQLRKQIGNLLESCLTNDFCQAYFFIVHEQLCVLLNIQADDKSEGIPDNETLLAIIQNIEQALLVSLILGVGNVCDDYKGIADSYDKAVQALSLDDILQHSEKSMKIIHAMDQGVYSHVYTNVLRAIRAYIMEHYGEKSLSLSQIAEEVHLTPSYISTIFKKYSQINIVDFMIEVRIKKAKELLEKTDLKSYEIAEKIGYVNSQYFSVLFKKTTSMSPTEYRQKSRENYVHESN